MRGREVTVFLVEDDDGDAKMVERAFQKAHVVNPLIRANDGVEALEMLRGENGQSSVERPFVLFVDIRMPRMDGLSFVKALREDEALKTAVVFVLTTSRHDEDMHRAYEMNVAGYIVKESAGRDFLDLIHLVGGYSRIVELP